MTRLLLFDIDGTLLLSGGAGKRALDRAFVELFGAPDAFADIPVAGRTDALIFADAVDRAGVRVDEAGRAAFFTRYHAYLAEEILRPGPRKGLMPGVAPLLARLRDRPDVVCAIVTGNFTQAARIKLEHFGVWHHFVCGAYGDDAPQRDDLVPIAVDRARGAGVEVVSTRDAIVIGDTPLDVRCAAAAGARSIGVATGSFDLAALAAAGADAVLPDLTDHDRFVALVADGVSPVRPPAQRGGSSSGSSAR